MSWLTPLPGQNGHHFADDIFTSIFMNDKFCISIGISLKFVSKSPIDNRSRLGSGNGLVPNRRHTINWTNAGPVHWRTYVALGGDEFNNGLELNLKAGYKPISKSIYSHSYPWSIHCWWGKCQFSQIRFHRNIHIQWFNVTYSINSLCIKLSIHQWLIARLQ